jgi:hypothetical protein
MESPRDCQCCRRPADGSGLVYRRNGEIVHGGALLQCDVCERYACSACLRVHDILSGYDFLCHDCLCELDKARSEVDTRTAATNAPRNAVRDEPS